MIDTMVTIKRNGATIYQNILCKFDNLTEDVIVDHHEVPEDFYRWMTYPGYVPVVQQGDLLVDQGTGPQNIDPNPALPANTPMQYRVRGNVETFAFHHVEAHVHHVRIK